MVRRLPSAEAFPAVMLAPDSANLSIAPLLGEQTGLCATDLVEVTSDSTIYLGEVRLLGENRIQIAVEHRLDRARLAEIARVWRRSEV